MYLELQNHDLAITDLPASEFGWASVHFRPNGIPWPVELQSLIYLGQEFWIIPQTLDAAPAIGIKVHNQNIAEHQCKILELSSVLSWQHKKGIEVLGFGHGGHLTCFLLDEDIPRSLGSLFDPAVLPEVKSEECKMALALMRDARSLKFSHYAFSFLQFWKVLEVTIGRGKIMSWMGQKLDCIEDREISKKVDTIRQSGEADLPKHFFESGRCAIAHAGISPTVSPDNRIELLRLARELSIIEYFATQAIRDKFEL